jgi:hypothetical protein
VTPLVLACALLSCHTGSSYTVGNAIGMTALGLASSAVSRASGGCYATCQQGEQCNERTGLCERLPCRGQCLPGEVCQESLWDTKCLPDASAAAVSTGALPPPAGQGAAPPPAPGQDPADPKPARSREP